MAGLGGDRAAAFDAVCERVREFFAGYRPPSFDHVPDPDAALFLCAMDHRTGYERAHRVEGEGPFEGSELLWAAGLRAARARPGLLTAAALSSISPAEVARAFEVDGETIADPERRAVLWRDLAAGLACDYGGRAEVLLASAAGRLGGEVGLVFRLAAYEAYADPLAKKAQLYAKICERRGWFEVADPESWEVAADNVLMRLALRSGLVATGELGGVRAATREAWKRVAAATAISPPLLDDMLWEFGRDDPNLLGAVAGELDEPPRDPSSAWY